MAMWGCFGGSCGVKSPFRQCRLWRNCCMESLRATGHSPAPWGIAEADAVSQRCCREDGSGTPFATRDHAEPAEGRAIRTGIALKKFGPAQLAGDVTEQRAGDDPAGPVPEESKFLSIPEDK